jgi:hypothetical protein
VIPADQVAGGWVIIQIDRVAPPKKDHRGMMREPTHGERVLLGVATAALIAWCLIVLVVALGYTGPTMGATWLGRIGLLAAGALITSVLGYVGVRTWRRAITRPLPAGRGSRWLASQPGWRLAAGCWALYVAPELGTRLWLTDRAHRAVATTPHITGLVSSVAGAALVGLLCRVLWHRQAENTASPLA